MRAQWEKEDERGNAWGCNQCSPSPPKKTPLPVNKAQDRTHKQAPNLYMPPNFSSPAVTWNGRNCDGSCLSKKKGSNLPLSSDDNEHKVRQYADDAVVQSGYANMITRLCSSSRSICHIYLRTTHSRINTQPHRPLTGIVSHYSARTHTHLDTAVCRSRALLGLTLQRIKSWDFPTPPRTPSYIFYQSRRTGVSAHRQLATHSQKPPEFAKCYSLKRWRKAEVLWGHLGVAVFILYFYWWAYRRWNEWKQHAAQTVVRFGGTDSVVSTQCSQLFDAWSVLSILLENNNILDWTLPCITVGSNSEWLIYWTITLTCYMLAWWH